MEVEWARAIWNSIHVNASLTDRGKMSPEEYERFFFALVEEKQISCEKCRVHTVNYANNNPIKNVGGRWRYLRWSFDFHNHVNASLGKSIFEWDRCLLIYGGETKQISMCNSGCNKGIKEKQEPLKKGSLIAPPRKSHIEEFIPPITTTKTIVKKRSN